MAGTYAMRRKLYGSYTADRLRREYYAAALRCDPVDLWALAGAAQDQGIAADVQTAYLQLYASAGVSGTPDPTAIVEIVGPARVRQTADQNITVNQ